MENVNDVKVNVNNVNDVNVNESEVKKMANNEMTKEEIRIKKLEERLQKLKEKEKIKNEKKREKATKEYGQICYKYLKGAIVDDKEYKEKFEKAIQNMVQGNLFEKE